MHAERQLSESISLLAQAVCGLTEQLIRDSQTEKILHRIEKKVDDMATTAKEWFATNGPKLVNIQAGIDRAQALIEKLQTSPGVFSPEDQATADELEKVVDTIGADANSVPTPPVA